MEKIPRADLLAALRECQHLFGQIQNAYQNDRAPDRANRLHVLYTRGFELCLEVLSHFPPDIRSRGGRGRAAALSPERRSAIARMGAEARWRRDNA